MWFRVTPALVAGIHVRMLSIIGSFGRRHHEDGRLKAGHDAKTAANTHQNGSLKPGGNGNPPVSAFIFSAMASSALARACMWAVRIRS